MTAQWDDEAAVRLMSKDRRSFEDPEFILKKLELEEGAVVADLGCGSGYFTIPIALHIGKTGTVYAVDSSSEMLTRLAENIKAAGVDQERVKVLEADLVRTRIPDHSVDVAFFANVLHDLSYKEGFISEVKRILKPNGIAADLDWNKSWKKSGPPIEIRIDKDAARKFLESNGLEIVHAVNVGSHHYMLVCQLNPRMQQG